MLVLLEKFFFKVFFLLNLWLLHICINNTMVVLSGCWFQTGCLFLTWKECTKVFHWFSDQGFSASSGPFFFLFITYWLIAITSLCSWSSCQLIAQNMNCWTQALHLLCTVNTYLFIHAYTACWYILYAIDCVLHNPCSQLWL